MKDTRQSLGAISVLCLLMTLCGFSSAQAQFVAVGDAPQPVITLDPPTGTDLQEQMFDAQGHALRLAPANFRRFGELKAGEVGRVHTLILRFAETLTLTHIKSTKDFRIEQGGTCVEGNVYVASTTCTLRVRFTPAAPGRRLGSVVLSHSGSTSATAFALSGSSYGPVVSFTPAQITTVPATVSGTTGIINGSTNLTIAGDVLYIADTGNDLIRKIDSSGTISNITAVAAPASLAVDSFGLIYVLGVPGSGDYFSYYQPNGGYTFYFTTYTPGNCTPATPCILGNVGMGSPAEINIDSNDNLFLEEETKGAMEAPVAGLIGEGILPPIDVWYLKDVFAYSSGLASTFAVDGSDNLYTDYTYGSSVCYVVQEPLYGAEGSNPNYTRVVGATKCGFSGDGGQATDAEIGSSIGQINFDLAGNLYFTDSANQRVRRVDAATGIIRTIAGNGTSGYKGDNGPATKAELATPTGVGIDSQGQVYLLSYSSTGPAQVVRKVGITGDLTFPSTAQGASSAVLLLNVTNTGNDTLSFVRDTITGADKGDFSIDPNTTNCNFAAGNYLYAGQSCEIGMIFKPAAVGARSATLNLLDNTVTGLNTVKLSGTATTAAIVKFTSPTAAQVLTSGTNVLVTVKVTASSGPTPTGTVKFTVDGNSVGSAALASGTASVNAGTLAAGTHKIVAAYSGDKYHPSAKATESITVSP